MNAKKKAFITGIGGQTGSYLAELLLEKDYEVHGLIRRTSGSNTKRIDHILDKITLHVGDLTDANNLVKILKEVMPHEIYNFAAMSQVRVSYDMPAFTGEVTGIGYAKLIEAVRAICPDAKVYQACSSEMFGDVLETPQKETTPFNPQSPYGVAKVYTYFIGNVFRKGYGMKIYNGICFNHESPRRGEEFLSKKVVKAAVRIKRGEQKILQLGNLSAKRDMGYAKEYAYWIWKMVQGEPGDYVLATGETHSMEEFVEEAFSYLGLNWREYVVFDQKLTRSAEVNLLLGDYAKAKETFGYEPQTKFKELIHLMVDAELNGTY